MKTLENILALMEKLQAAGNHHADIKNLMLLAQREPMTSENSHIFSDIYDVYTSSRYRYHRDSNLSN